MNLRKCDRQRDSENTTPLLQRVLNQSLEWLESLILQNLWIEFQVNMTQPIKTVIIL